MVAHGQRLQLALWFSAGVLSWFSSTASAQISPADPQEQPRSSSPANMCGLEETEPTDPDWVLVTSNLILRANLCVASEPCVAEHWYDRVLNPCYKGKSRYWKFAEGSDSAFAYPMAALGVGTFDGLYVRRNVPFQLYEGVGDEHPFGPLMTGPQYISIDVWRDVYPACDGFEPGTFFVSGGAGALSGYSIKLNGGVEILALSPNLYRTTAEHGTSRYTSQRDDLVLRRGNSYTFSVKLSREYSPSCHVLYLETTHSFDGVPKTTRAPVSVASVNTNGDGTKTVQVEVDISADAAVGRYEFKIFVRKNGQTEPDAERDFEQPVFIVFNPWCAGDDVYLPDPGKQFEYVLNEAGIIWDENYQTVIDPSNYAWNYAQFNTLVFDTAMNLLDGAHGNPGLGSVERSSPIHVSRYMSRLVNAHDDNGILKDAWEDYAGGQEPGFWRGTDQILDPNVTFSYEPESGAGIPARYGQCFTFGGVLTSMLRTLGIPARPVTNIESAHDRDPPGNPDWMWVDLFYDADWHKDDDASDESWNFHV